jgi:methionine transaminase
MISKLPNIGTNIFSTMSALALEHDAINLSQGFPDYAMNEKLCNMVHEAMLAGNNQYAPMAGVIELREAITQKVELLYNKKINPANEVTITPGGTYGIYTALTTIIKPGDEVIIFEPAYDSYIPGIELNFGKVVCVNLEGPTYCVPWIKVQNAVNNKTKAIIINTPHNPCGYTFTPQDWITLNNIIADKDIYVISDEVYEHIVMDEAKHESILRYPELWNKTIAVFSFGKIYHNTGWKIGYVIAPDTLMNEFRKVHQFICFTVHAPAQVALAKFMQEPTHYLELPMFFQAKRDFFLQQMQNSKFILYQKAQGSFFQTLSYENISELPDTEFATELTKKYGVACIPVSAFYSKKVDNKLVRFCFAKREETLLAACKKLSAIDYL